MGLLVIMPVYDVVELVRTIRWHDYWCITVYWRGVYDEVTVQVELVRSCVLA